MIRTNKEPITCDICGDKSTEYMPMTNAMGRKLYICRTCSLKEGLIEETENEIIQSLKIITPKEIVAKLDEVVVGQEDAKMTLAIEIYNHLTRLKNKKKLIAKGKMIKKNNILLTGLSGSGKTLLAETIANIIGIPFTITNATTLTESGYVGEDVENLIVSLLAKCDFNVKRAEKGIIFLDEADKISKKGENLSLTRDVSGEGVQQGLLKMLEGDLCRIPPNGGRKHPHQQMIEVDTTDILFIAGGAFVGVEYIVEERLRKKYKNDTSIGFMTGGNTKRRYTPEELRANIIAEDLRVFGMIPEFLGRFPVISNLEPLSEEHLVSILKLENGILDEYVTYFDLLGKELVVDEEALYEVARKAIERGVGARGLRTILKEILKTIMYEAPSDLETKYYRINDMFIEKIYHNKLQNVI